MSFALDRVINRMTARQIAFILGAIVLLGLVVRLRYMGHYPTWDEAIHLILIRQLVKFHSFTEYWLVRPPIFSILATALAFVFGPKQLVVVAVSLIASLASIVLIYKIGSEFVNRAVGLGAAFLLAVMPMNAWYSTWVKQDALMTTLMLASVYLFLKGRSIVSGIALGFAMLTKEPAAILIGVLFIFTLVRRSREDWKAFLVTSLVGLAIGGWWWLVARGRGQILPMLLGTSAEARYWHAPFYEYLLRLPLDIGIGAFLALLAGLYIAFRKPVHLKNNPAILLTLIWAVLVYGFYSIIYAKEPWSFYMATPAIGMIGGLGLLSFESLLDGAGKLHQSRLIAQSSIGTYLIGVVVVLALGSAMVNYVQLLPPIAKSLNKAATLWVRDGRALKTMIRSSDKIALPSRYPIIVWHSGVDDRNVYDIPGSVLIEEEELPEAEPVKITQQFANFIADKKIDWVVLNDPEKNWPIEFNFLKDSGTPFKRVGPNYIFNTSKLHK